ncbi:MAG TPA: hypothetical protein ACFYD2_02705 [Candidatus Avalokitesvara rifleensis]|uniref:hypothetical protein n=1 Tax=Candidatus Avalokitesvara rifleensis TaxID=3367620 RepID=UPI004024CFC9
MTPVVRARPAQAAAAAAQEGKANPGGIRKKSSWPRQAAVRVPRDNNRVLPKLREAQAPRKMVLSSKRRVLPGPEVNPRQRPPVQRVKDEIRLAVKAESPKKGASLREVLKPKGSLRPEVPMARALVEKVNRKGLWLRKVTAVKADRKELQPREAAKAVVTKLRVPEKSRLIKAEKADKAVAAARLRALEKNWLIKARKAAKREVRPAV